MTPADAWPCILCGDDVESAETALCAACATLPDALALETAKKE